MNTTAAEDSFLPALREDLQLLRGPATVEGTPTWNIFDPIRSKYFRIGWISFELLKRWSSGTISNLIQRVTSETTCKVNEDDINDLIKFLYANSLTRESTGNSSKEYLAQFQATKMHWVKWLIKNYLFFRIPLVRPHNFLVKTLPFVEPFFSKTFRLLVILCGVLGIYLVAKQWENFIGTFIYFFSLQGIVFYFFVLVILKIFHELGHAYTTVRYGCGVPTMGVAVLVMFPVLYTDTTEAWQLISRRQRLHIGAAGMITELYIALIATFIWSFLPDGIFRSVAFIFATTSWITSLAINLNIFMRFDGYYILSDYWGIENLQERSFAIGKWKLREILFNLKRPPPEIFSRNTLRKLVLYAWSVWIYRLFLFIGIALLVYHFFFKLLGLILFAIEIIWFILIPVRNEIMVWWILGTKALQSGRVTIVFTLILFGVSILFIPFNTQISVPAILQVTNQAKIHTAVAGRINQIYIKEDDTVTRNQILLTLESPHLNNEINRTLKEISVVELRSSRRAASPEDLANLHVILEKLQQLRSKLGGLYELKDKLTIRAPIQGKVVDLIDNIHPGRWINEQLEIATIIQSEELKLVGLIDDDALNRVAVNQPAVFYPYEPELGKLNAEVLEIESSNISNLKELYLASIYDGDVPVRKDAKQELVPEGAWYRIWLLPKEKIEIHNKTIKGDVYITGEPRSFASRIYNNVVSVLIKESGF